MKEISLTQNKVALVDDEDFEWLNQFKWYACWSGWVWYAIRKSPILDGKRITILMHREIMNAPNGVPVDHRNSNGLDNRRENVRLCTNQQNMHNRKKANRNNKLGIKGVCWHRNTKKFRSQINLNGKKIHLGLFNVLGDADSAYRKAEEKYFGEFARRSYMEVIDK